MSARSSLITRRAVLWSGLGVAAAGAGAAAGVLLPARPPRPRTPAPQPLLDALAAEQRLVAMHGAAVTDESLREPMALARADHLAHQEAIRAMVAAFGPAAAAASLPALGPPTREVLHATETQAASTAQARAAALTGRAATVLASIAACEATHAELFR
jgi:hypothetical protein